MMPKKSQLKTAQPGALIPWAGIILAPFGKLGVRTLFTQDSLFISEVAYAQPEDALVEPQNALAEQFFAQAQAYFEDPSFQFNLPKLIKGTVFQRKVWDYIEKIPFGQVRPYGHVAQAIHSAPRAVGGACGANPYPLIVPCHRVISASGIGGFVKEDGEGYARNIKTWLLQHEGVQL